MSNQFNELFFDRRFYVLAVVLALCVLLETLSLTYIQQSGDTFYYSSSIMYFISGLGICLLPLIPIAPNGKTIKGIASVSGYMPIIFGLFFLFILGYHIGKLMPMYAKFPIDKQWADMFPTIQVGCQRFLTGKVVYAPTPEIWVGSIFPYFPMMWIPFLPAQFYSFDYRWTTVALQFIGIAIIFLPVLKRQKGIPILPSFIIGTALFFLVNFFLMQNISYWVMTEEGVVACFYLLLSVALLRKNYVLIGLAMTTCTLSRYGLLFWIPVYFGYVLLTQSRSSFWKLFWSYGISMTVLFIIPFFMWNPAYFLNIPTTYTNNMDRFWISNDIDAHKYYNVGFFKFFTHAVAHTMTIWAVASSFTAPLLLLIFVKKLGIKSKYIAYASLKLSLIFFYGFISIPYQYVFVPATLMSYVILFDYLAYDKEYLKRC